MYAMDGQTDARTKATLIAPFPAVGSIINERVTWVHKSLPRPFIQPASK